MKLETFSLSKVYPNLIAQLLKVVNPMSYIELQDVFGLAMDQVKIRLKWPWEIWGNILV
jgi:hypothetical protein